MKKRTTLVIGGGFFGCTIGAHLSSQGHHVVLCEMGTDLMKRASWANQARIHNGYHYPRSMLTALRSRVNFPRFVQQYGDCVVSDFEKYYAIPWQFSKVSAQQFADFMHRIGAPIRQAPERIRNLFDMSRIEDVFTVKEYAFNADRLREIARHQLDTSGVDVRLSHRVLGLSREKDGLLHVQVEDTAHSRKEEFVVDDIFNCTYSGLNAVLSASGAELIPLKHELTEMALIEPPDELKDKAVTVMCGPFFSLMPFPSRKLHTLSHVRYTPHCWWQDQGDNYTHPYDVIARAQKTSRYEHMVRDASRYLPCLRNSRRKDSIWEVKTVLPRSEVDDSRPILYCPCPNYPEVTSVLGGKIDNIYDMLFELDART